MPRRNRRPRRSRRSRRTPAQTHREDARLADSPYDDGAYYERTTRALVRKGLVSPAALDYPTREVLSPERTPR